MKGRLLTAAEIAEFTEHLVLEERSAATVEKYVRDVRAFAAYAPDGKITKETVIAYKKTPARNLRRAERKLHAGQHQLSIHLSRLARPEGKNTETAAAGLLPRRKGADPAGVHSPVPCGGAQTQPATLSDFADHLRHRHPGQ